jgi:hypothetical protein
MDDVYIVSPSSMLLIIMPMLYQMEVHNGIPALHVAQQDVHAAHVHPTRRARRTRVQLSEVIEMAEIVEYRSSTM